MPTNLILKNCGSANPGQRETPGEYSLSAVDRKIYLTHKPRPEGRDRAELKSRASETGNGWF